MGFLEEVAQEMSPPFFQSLEQGEWNPKFEWHDTLDSVANAINRPHEDYPARISDTESAIAYASYSYRFNLETVKNVHQIIFPDHMEKAGEWRDCNVRVGVHVAPSFEVVPTMMLELMERYRDYNWTEDIMRFWYQDFNTIHPFVDGNGRVSGTIVAAMTKLRHERYLGPCQ